MPRLIQESCRIQMDANFYQVHYQCWSYPKTREEEGYIDFEITSAIDEDMNDVLDNFTKEELAKLEQLVADEI